jgi:hypothetical protein
MKARATQIADWLKKLGMLGFAGPTLCNSEMGGINHLANQIGEHGARRDSASRGVSRSGQTATA